MDKTKDKNAVSKKNSAKGKYSKDSALKNFFGNPQIFKDIINGICFDGQDVVKAEYLKPYSTESNSKTKYGNKRLVRDCAMEWKMGDVSISIFGIENQTKKCEEMLGRVLMYDGSDIITHIRQMTAKEKKNRITCIPSITIVFYTGREDWELMENIKDLYDFSNIPLEIKDKVTKLFSHRDYNVIFFPLKKLEKSELFKFKGDSKIVINHLMEYSKHTDEEYNALDQVLERSDLVLDVLDAFSKTNEWSEAFESLEEDDGMRKEEITMCDILKKIKGSSETERLKAEEKSRKLEEETRKANAIIAEKDKEIAELKRLLEQQK